MSYGSFQISSGAAANKQRPLFDAVLSQDRQLQCWWRMLTASWHGKRKLKVDSAEERMKIGKTPSILMAPIRVARSFSAES